MLHSEEVNSADGKVIGWLLLVLAEVPTQQATHTHSHNEPPFLLPSQTNLNLSAGIGSLRQEMPDKLLLVKWRRKKQKSHIVRGNVHT